MFDYDSLRIALYLGMTAFFFIAIVAAGLWEKRPVQPFYVPDEGDEYEPSADAEQANDEAEESGYRHGGICHDGKGRLYRVRYDFWIAPDQRTLAIVGGGTVARVPVNDISFYSCADDSRVLWTTNNKGEQDISGVTDPDAWPRLPFKRLLRKHQQRLSQTQSQPFPQGNPMAGYFDIRRRQADKLVEEGSARYIDDSNSAWRYTLKGALKFYFIGVWIRPLGRRLRPSRLKRR